MEANYLSPDNFNDDNDFDNIVRINNSSDSDFEDDDYDFDYDPNEQYYA